MAYSTHMTRIHNHNITLKIFKISFVREKQNEIAFIHDYPVSSFNHFSL